MDTLTKVLARHVYNLELENLPLDRLTERKALKRGAAKSAIMEVVIIHKKNEIVFNSYSRV